MGRHRKPDTSYCLNPIVSPIEKQSGQGLLTTLKGAGLEADPSGGWITEKPIHDEVDLMEASFFDDFRKGEIQEEDLREALEYCAEGRELKGLGPSKIRESDIEEARLQRLAAKGDEIVIEEALEKTQPSQGQGGKASSGNKCAKGAKEPPKGREKGKRGRKG